jgi:hypothetical protein
MEGELGGVAPFISKSVPDANEWLVSRPDRIAPG